MPWEHAQVTTPSLLPSRGSCCGGSSGSQAPWAEQPGRPPPCAVAGSRACAPWPSTPAPCTSWWAVVSAPHAPCHLAWCGTLFSSLKVAGVSRGCLGEQGVSVLGHTGKSSSWAGSGRNWEAENVSVGLKPHWETVLIARKTAAPSVWLLSRGLWPLTVPPAGRAQALTLGFWRLLIEAMSLLNPVLSPPLPARCPGHHLLLAGRPQPVCGLGGRAAPGTRPGSLYARPSRGTPRPAGF